MSCLDEPERTATAANRPHQPDRAMKIFNYAMIGVFACGLVMTVAGSIQVMIGM